MTLVDLKQSVRFFGRTVPTEDGVFCNWSGSGFTFTFTGTAAQAVFSSLREIPGENPVYMGVFVDESPYLSARFPITKSGETYTLAERLPYGTHTVRVVRETEIYYGFIAVQSLETDGTAEGKPPLPPFRLEFIGDSIICGYGNISSVANPEFTTAEENFTDTFAFQCASLLRADYAVVAASGNGFAHHYGCETGNLIPELYDYTDKLFADAKGIAPQKWDFSRDACNAVIIKLGPNDSQFCFGADLPEEERKAELLAERKADFVLAAQDFFKKILRYRPHTPIILIFEEDMRLKPELCLAAKAFPEIHCLEILPKREYEGVGANGHYSRFTHARVAGLLTEKLRSLL